MRKPVSLVVMYICLATGCAAVGVILTYALLFACQYYGIDLSRNWWLLILPVALAVILNVGLLELYRKFRKG